MEDDMDMDDLDMDNFDIPLPTMGKSTVTSTPSLSLNRNVSFGPAVINSNTPEKKLDQPKIEDKNEKNIFTSPPPLSGKKGPSIASFLKENIKSSTMDVFKGMSATASLLMTPSLMNLKERTPSFSGHFSKPNEESKEIEAMDMEEFDEFDDMDLDDIPEPTLKQ